MPDISQLVRSSGIDLERTSTQLFGMAVEDFSTSTVNPILSAAFGVDENKAPNRNDGTWYGTDYAATLANTQFRPKLKFLFKVEFLFHPEVLARFGAETADWKRNFIFNIKTVDRPKVDFEYEEVNQYNFRTKVLKQIKHRELTMSFADDTGCSVHEFFRFMMMVHSPITRRSATDSFDIAQVHTESTGSGMLFDENPVSMNDMANRGVIDSPIGNAIKAIKITQFFTDITESLDYAPKEVAFFFINPRVVSFDLDDVSHESSDPNSFTMSFDYDSMTMTRARTLVPDPDKSKQMAPWKGSPGDASPTGNVASNGASGARAGDNNPYARILAGVAGTAVSRITNDTIGRAIRKIPGGSLIASNLQGLAGGAVGSAINGTVAGIGNVINQSFARPSRDVVTDDSTAGFDFGSIIKSSD